MQTWIDRLHAAAGLVEHLMSALELVLIAIVGRLATWAAPLPAAYLVGRSAAVTFDLDGSWPWIMAGIIELIGLVTSSLWITSREWNANKRKTDPEANERLAVALMSIYFATTFALLLSVELPIYLDTGRLEGLTALLFPCLSAVALLALNERAAQSKRQGEYDAGVAAKKRQKSGKKAARKTTIVAGKSIVSEPFTTVKTKDRAMAILTERTDISGAELGRQLGKSTSLGRQLKRELLPLLSGDNGRGESAEE